MLIHTLHRSIHPSFPPSLPPSLIPSFLLFLLLLLAREHVQDEGKFGEHGHVDPYVHQGMRIPLCVCVCVCVNKKIKKLKKL